MKKAFFDFQEEMTPQNILRICKSAQEILEGSHPLNLSPNHKSEQYFKDLVYSWNFEPVSNVSFSIVSAEFEIHACFLTFLEAQSALCNRVREAFDRDPQKFFDPLWSGFTNWIKFQLFVAASRNELPESPNPVKSKKSVKNKK